MQDYDVALKNLLTKPGSLLLQTLLGTPAVKWLNVESPKVRDPRPDQGLKATKAHELTRLGLQIANAGCIEELFAQ